MGFSTSLEVCTPPSTILLGASDFPVIFPFFNPPLSLRKKVGGEGGWGLGEKGERLSNKTCARGRGQHVVMVRGQGRWREMEVGEVGEGRGAERDFAWDDGHMMGCTERGRFVELYT